MKPTYLALTLLTAPAVIGCHTWTPAPIGASAPPIAATTFDYPSDVTHANGWRSLADSAGRHVAEDAEYSRALAAFRRVTSQRAPFRVVVYYNGALSPAVSSVRRRAAGVLEMDFEEHGSKGSSWGRRTIRVYEGEVDGNATVGTQNLDAVIAQRLESAVINHLIEGNARVVDKGLLYRKASRDKGVASYSDAELRALSTAVDLVLEVTFVPNSAAPDGFEIGLRAIRTSDAAVLSQISSAELVPRTRVSRELVAREGGGGYVEQARTTTVSLRDLCHSVMRQAMQQVASRY